MKKKYSKNNPSVINSAITVKAAMAAAGVIAGSVLWITFGTSKPVPVPAYTVQRVIDGDTFVTTENQYVRIASVEAPESGKCGGPEAKTALETLVMDKPVLLKVLYRDPYDRLVSQVYTQETYVNQALIHQGYAYYLPRDKAENVTELKLAGEYAREKQLGVYSETCTQKVNTNNPSCNIKGNTRNGNIYYVPECGVYKNTVVQLYLGDRWFCTEKEAIEAGFRAPAQCP